MHVLFVTFKWPSTQSPIVPCVHDVLRAAILFISSKVFVLRTTFSAFPHSVSRQNWGHFGGLTLGHECLSHAMSRIHPWNRTWRLGREKDDHRATTTITPTEKEQGTVIFDLTCELGDENNLIMGEAPKRANFSALSPSNNGFTSRASPLANSKPGSSKKLIIKNFKGGFQTLFIWLSFNYCLSLDFDTEQRETGVELFGGSYNLLLLLSAKLNSLRRLKLSGSCKISLHKLSLRAHVIDCAKALERGPTKYRQHTVNTNSTVNTPSNTPSTHRQHTQNAF